MKSIVVIFSLILTINELWSQEQVEMTRNVSPLHRANLGSIRFMANNIPLESLKEEDFLTTYNLTHKSGLYISAFLNKSLSYYLHTQAPELHSDELDKAGCYHFSFYVDKRLVYQDTLHEGSISPEIRNTETILSKPLIGKPRTGWWSEFLWYRFLNNGGKEALTDGKHAFKIEMRTYVKNPDFKLGPLIASGQIKLNVKFHSKINISKVKINKIKAYPGFPVSSEKFDLDKIKELKGKIEAEVFKEITSVVVIKNNKLLIEEYFNKADRNMLHDVRSVGKSYASTLTGIAIKNGYLKSESLPLSDFYDLKDYDNYSPKKNNILLKDLLTMSSIFEGNDDKASSPGNEENMYPTQNWVKFVLDLPTDTIKPKREWQYFTAGVVLLGDILDKKVPGGLEQYADIKLFRPLGITEYKWQYTPQKVANTAGGIQMNALDFAKYGQLYKNGGKWNGNEILSEEWIKKTFIRHQPIPGRNDEYYGYLFWNKTYRIRNKNYEAFYCAGNGGNKIFVFKDHPLVVVITSTAYGMSYSHAQVDKIMSDYILPGVLGFQ